MPRFHFHLWEAGRFVEDENGVDLTDRSAAVLIAKRTLGEMLCDDLHADREIAGRCIVIADEGGATIAEVCAPHIETAGPEERVSIGSGRVLA